MFDLNRELAAWCKAVRADRCHADSSIEELKDHLRCEIDRLKSEGMPEEQAFRDATERLGDARALHAEFDKNSSWFSHACRVLRRYDKSISSQAGREILISHSLIWAALMLATALIFSTNDAADSSDLIMSFIFFAWLASHQLLQRALKANTG